MPAKDADAVFAAASVLERLSDRPPEIVTDGTWVEVERYSAGKRGFHYASNGFADDQLSSLLLKLGRQHVPASELPRSADWRHEPAKQERAD